MSFFSSASPLKRFTPKTAKLSDIYRRQTGLKNLSATAQIQAKEALAKAGYSDSQISRIVTENQMLPVAKIKEVMGYLSQRQVSGFATNPQKALEKYLRQESVKKKNIADRRQEYLKESMKEDFTKKTPKPAGRPGVKLPY